MLQKIVSLLALALGFGLLFTNLRLVSFIFVVLVLGAVIRIGSSGYLTRTILSFLGVVCSWQILAIIFWKLKIPFIYAWALVPVYLCAAAYFLRRGLFIRENFILKKSEFVALLVGLVSVGIIGIFNFHGASARVQSIRFVSRGLDNSNHLSMVHSVFNNHGYVYGPEADTKEKILENAGSYPQGWHLTTATLLHGALGPNTATVNQLLVGFTFVSLAWYFILLYLLTAVVLSLVDHQENGSIRWAQTAFCVAAILVLQIILLVGLLSSGFINFIAVICYLLALVLLFAQLMFDKIPASRYFFLGSVLSAGVAFTWVLMAPISYLLVLLPVGQRVFTNYRKKAYRSIPWRASGLFVLGLLALALGSVQGLVQLKYSSGIKLVNMPGSAYPINLNLLLVFFSATLVCIGSKATHIHIRKLLSTVLILTLPVVSVLYYYQYQTAGAINYYFDKTLVAVVIFLFIGALLAGSSAVKTLGSRLGMLSAAALSVVCVMSIPIIFRLDTASTKYVFGFREVSVATAETMDELTQTIPDSTDSIIVAKGMSWFEDVSASHFLTRAVAKSRNECRPALYNMAFDIRNQSHNDLLKNCALKNDSKQYIILTTEKNVQLAEEEFAPYRNIQVAPIN